MAADPIPVVCSHCGKPGGFFRAGHAEVRVEVWRDLETVWDPFLNALRVTESDRLQSDADYGGLEDAIDDTALDRYCCANCATCKSSLEDLVAPKYGADHWGRVLDENGTPYGPMKVSDQQLVFAV